MSETTYKDKLVKAGQEDLFKHLVISCSATTTHVPGTEVVSQAVEILEEYNKQLKKTT